MMTKRKLLLSALAMLSIAGLAACNPAATDKDFAAVIHEAKTNYVGDNSKVIAIVSNLTYPHGAKFNSIEIHSAQEPYGLDVYLKTEGGSPTADDLFKNAAVTFSLIGNLGQLNYLDANNHRPLASFSRTNTQERLKASQENSLEKIANSPESIKSYLEQ